MLYSKTKMAASNPDTKVYVGGRFTTSEFAAFQKFVDSIPGASIPSLDYACDVPGCTAPYMKERALCRCGEHDLCSDHMAPYQRQAGDEKICQDACERALCELEEE